MKLLTRGRRSLLTPQMLKVMKLTFILLTAAFLQVSANGHSQTVTFSGKNVSLLKVFAAIKSQTGYVFFYDADLIEESKPVTLDVKNVPLENALEEVFKNQPLSWSIVNKTITISRKQYPIIDKKKEESLPPPPILIKGRIVNEAGEPVAGATVKIKGTNIGTSTNDNGEFSLDIPDPNMVLVITAINIETIEVKVNAKTELGTIYTKKAVKALDETIIRAYGTTTKRLNTGNISKISSEEISRQPVSNPLATIQGRAPGVFINTQNGMPGGNISVLIRGRGSINAGIDPLYIIDGVPFSSTPLDETFSTLSTGITGKISPLNSINPLDIESIEILKDADATAIYGSRAANGVVLITTKKGQSGKTKFNINVQTGFSRLADFPELLNLEEYLKLRYEGFQNSGSTPTVTNAPDLLIWDTTKSINWPKYILGGTAHTSNIQAGISGGNEHTNFLISGNYRTEGTILPGDQQYYRAGAHIMLQHKSINKKFSVELSSSFTSDNSKQLPSSIFSVLTLPPNIPIYDNAGNFNWLGFNGINPVAVMKRKSKSETDNFLTNLIFQYSVLPNLLFRTSLGYTKIEMDQVMTYPLVSLDPSFGSPSNAYYGNNKNKSFIIEPQLEYTKKLNKSSFQILVGSSWQKSIREGDFIAGQNYSNDDLLEYVGAAGSTTASNLLIEYKYASIFSRLHYNFKDKYIVNLSIRRDGSSRFGPGNQFGNFGAMGAAWVFSRETFLANSTFLSYGKLRTSYGITGNDQISDYQYLSSYRSGSNYQGITGLTPARIANADFRWESNKKFETALELGFLKDKILITAVWYKNRSGNQLIDYPLPYTSGPFGSYQANLPALVENKGWEFDFNTFPIRSNNIIWSVLGNITIPKNKLLQYPGLASSSFSNTYVIGEDLSIRRAFNFTGINPQTGIPEYEDINQDGVISAPADWTTIGRTSPYFYGGFGSDFGYKKFQLNIFFHFAKQYAQGSSTIPGTRSNKFKVALSRWQKPGDATTIPKAVISANSAYLNLAQSDAAFYNASYMRLKNVALSYQLAGSLMKKLKINTCKFSIEGQNLFTWRKEVNLFDPETGNSGIAPFKSIVFTIQLTF